MNLRTKIERQLVATRLELIRDEIQDRVQELVEVGKKPGGGSSYPLKVVKLSDELIYLKEEQSALAQELELYDNLLRFQENQKVKK